MVWSFNFDFFNFSFPFWCFLDEIWFFRTLFLEEMISLHPLQNNFPSLTIKFLPRNCLSCSCNGTFVVSLFPLHSYFPLVDSKDQSWAIVEGTGLRCPSECPSMSCKFWEDGVALADAILFEQACEWPLRVNCWPAWSRLLSSQMHSVHTSVTEMILSNTKANHHNAFEF